TSMPSGFRITTRTVPPTPGDRPRPPACPSRGHSATNAGSPRGWSRRRRRPRPEPRRSARYAPRGRAPRSPSLLPFLQVLADDIEEALPALPLALDPIRGLGKRLRPQGETVGPAVDHAAHNARLLQHLQVP